MGDDGDGVVADLMEKKQLQTDTSNYQNHYRAYHCGKAAFHAERMCGQTEEIHFVPQSSTTFLLQHYTLATS